MHRQATTCQQEGGSLGDRVKLIPMWMHSLMDWSRVRNRQSHPTQTVGDVEELASGRLPTKSMTAEQSHEVGDGREREHQAGWTGTRRTAENCPEVRHASQVPHCCTSDNREVWELCLRQKKANGTHQHPDVNGADWVSRLEHTRYVHAG